MAARLIHEVCDLPKDTACALCPRGMAGKRYQGWQDTLGFPLQTPGELEQLCAELGIAAVFHPEGLDLAGEAPRVPAVLTASWAVRPESSSPIPTVQPAGLMTNPCSHPGQMQLSQPPCPTWVLRRAPFALPRRAGFALMSC